MLLHTGYLLGCAWPHPFAPAWPPLMPSVLAPAHPCASAQFCALLRPQGRTCLHHLAGSLAFTYSLRADGFCAALRLLVPAAGGAAALNAFDAEGRAPLWGIIHAGAACFLLGDSPHDYWRTQRRQHLESVRALLGAGAEVQRQRG
jgi:hypothetical protein